MMTLQEAYNNKRLWVYARLVSELAAEQKVDVEYSIAPTSDPQLYHVRITTASSNGNDAMVLTGTIDECLVDIKNTYAEFSRMANVAVEQPA